MFNKSLNIWHSCFCFIIAIPWKITRKNNAKYLYTLKPWFNEQVRHMYLVCSLYRIIYYIKCKMLSKSSKWELDLVHYIAKFTISRFECNIKWCNYLGFIPVKFCLMQWRYQIFQHQLNNEQPRVSVLQLLVPDRLWQNEPVFVVARALRSPAKLWNENVLWFGQCHLEYYKT